MDWGLLSAVHAESQVKDQALPSPDVALRLSTGAEQPGQPGNGCSQSGLSRSLTPSWHRTPGSLGSGAPGQWSGQGLSGLSSGEDPRAPWSGPDWALQGLSQMIPESGSRERNSDPGKLVSTVCVPQEMSNPLSGHNAEGDGGPVQACESHVCDVEFTPLNTRGERGITHGIRGFVLFLVPHEYFSSRFVGCSFLCRSG